MKTTSMHEDPSTWLGGLDQWLCKAVEDIDGDASLVERLIEPMRITRFRIPVHTGDTTRFLTAWRVLDSNLLGPGKGGIRLSPHANEDEVRALTQHLKDADAAMAAASSSAALIVKSSSSSEQGTNSSSLHGIMSSSSSFTFKAS